MLNVLKVLLDRNFVSGLFTFKPKKLLKT